jgi:triosephosphate isomerase (TIM)
MNPQTLADARALAVPLEHRLHKAMQKVDVVLCPPFIFLPALSNYLDFTLLGAQNVSWAKEGAFTGEISAQQLKNWKVSYVILGHSERRLYLGETDSIVNAKLAAALIAKMTPVVCLGGEEGAVEQDMQSLVTRQFNGITKDLDSKHLEKVIFVYEPIWAISTMSGSKPASGEHALGMITHIQDLLGKRLGVARSKNMRILYGGTVNQNNVHEFSKFPQIDGALVGSASLDLENFWAVIEEFARESLHKS